MLLQDHTWQCKYSPADGLLLNVFLIPALSCAVRYDRTTGYFQAEALAKAAQGVEALARNRGRMRLIVGCTLNEAEVEAIRRGEDMRDTVASSLLCSPFPNRDAGDAQVLDALELLAWMVAKGHLEVKVALPCDPQSGAPRAGEGLFHEKAGIIEDQNGDRLVFNGSLNETPSGWTKNWDSFHVFCSWKDDAAHLDIEAESFARLWANREPSALVLDLGAAARERLLQYLPPGDELPNRLRTAEPEPAAPPSPASASEPAEPEPPPEPEPESPSTPHAPEEIWDFIRTAPQTPGSGDTVGQATCAVLPWPHQVRAFRRMYDNWPPRLLIADEVGLGKTIEAGLLIRQAWLSGRARRILILAPKAVLKQWQIELREKFNLSVPIYETGQLLWPDSPGRFGETRKKVTGGEWLKEPLVLVSSQLMQRRERTRELLEAPEPWDVVVLDEAHHARRSVSAVQAAAQDRPNRLLRLMRGLKDKTAGLILLTATPMQVHPVEVWDLLHLLGLPPEWTAERFLRFFEHAAHESPDEHQLADMAALFRVMEQRHGEMPTDAALRLDPEHSAFRAGKVLKALRGAALTPLKKLDITERRFAVALMRSWNPTRMLISRHTRELLRRYHAAGTITTAVARRQVQDILVDLNPAERALYEAVEDYIATTYNKAKPEERHAVGFVMTIYRRRLASSFDALEQTLKKRLAALAGGSGWPEAASAASRFIEEDLPEDELNEAAEAAETADEDDPEARAGQALDQALLGEERQGLEALLAQKRALPKGEEGKNGVDSKAVALLEVLADLRQKGHDQVIVFTQFTDTLDSLRAVLTRQFGPEAMLCFSGRGGEQWQGEGWANISRDRTKELFRQGRAKILLCTDAAAEGLNLQSCGALINYDMPWNPMKVEQRIGRIDRLGQKFPEIAVRNLMYRDTVESDVYLALRQRIQLFDVFVGRLQPILSRLPRAFGELALTRDAAADGRAARLADELTGQLDQQAAHGFDLDEIQPDDLEMPRQDPPAYDLARLGEILRAPALLPPGYEATALSGGKDLRYRIPGRREAIRVTTDPDFYEQHAESVELWSPGSPAFPWNA